MRFKSIGGNKKGSSIIESSKIQGGNNNNLKEDSIILLEQIKTIDKKRLRDKIGCLSGEDMKKVNKSLKVNKPI